MARRSGPLHRLLSSTLAFTLVSALMPIGPISTAVAATPVAPSANKPTLAGQRAATRSRLNVRWRPGVSAAQISASAQKLGFKVVGKKTLGWTQLEPAKSMKPGVLATALRDAHLVREAEPAKWYRPSDVTSNDTYFENQWGLKNTGQLEGTVGADIKATEAWSSTTGSKDVVVAVVDEGVNWAHPDLSANMWLNTKEVPNNGMDDDHDGYVDDVRGFDFYNYDGTVYDQMDGDRHGTHVAGIIGAQGNNGQGVAGVNWNVTIMPLKFLGPFGGDDFAGAEAIQYAVDHGATVINCSWGGEGGSAVLDDAIEYAAAHDVLIVCAAGNDSTNIDQRTFYPAASPATNVVTVAATDRNDELAWFSNYGAENVDLAAPGFDVTSTLPAECAGVFVDSAPYKISYLPIQAEVLEPASERDSIITKAVARLGEPTTTPILVVDDSAASVVGEHQGARLSVYTDALAAAGYAEVSTWVTDVSGVPTEEAMRGKIVLWFTGAASSYSSDLPSINGVEQSAIKDYLDNGGRLVMISGEMALDLAWSESEIDLLGEYFHVMLSDYATWCGDFIGKAGTSFAGIKAALPTEYVDGPRWTTGSDSICPLGDGATVTQMSTLPYGKLSGTSMAAPHVTGAVGLLKAAFPSATGEELQARIVNTVDAKASLDGKCAFGGRLNLAAALSGYPGRPTITAPKPGSKLHAGTTSTLKWKPAAGGSPDATFTAEIGLPYTVWNNDLESGTLDGFIESAESSAAWGVTMSDVHGGSYAAASGDPGPATERESGETHASSAMQTTVTVPAEGGQVSFWWKLNGPSSPEQAGFFWVDDASSTSIYDTVWNNSGWTLVTLQLPAGEHALHWDYENYESVSAGENRLLVDDIVVTSHAFSPLATASAGATSTDFSVPTTDTADAWIRLRASLDGVNSAWVYTKQLQISTDLVAPAAPADLEATPDGDGSVGLSWTNPGDSDFEATRIVWSADATPTGPEDPDATVAYEGDGTTAKIGPLPDGTTVRIKAYACDRAGNWSDAATGNAVVADTIAPQAVAFLNGRHRDGAVTLGWTPPLASSYATLTVLARTDTTPTAGDTTATVVFSGRGASVVDTLGAYPKAADHVIYSVYSTDFTGNVSAVRSIRVGIDDAPPVGTISLNGGEDFTTGNIVAVHSAVTSATEMRFFTNGEYDDEALWQPFSADTFVTLLPLDGLQTVMGEFRDAQGNVMQTTSAIYLDLLAPEAPTGMSATNMGAMVVLDWGMPSDMSVVAYRIDRATSPSGPWSTISWPTGEPADEGFFFDDTVNPSTTYYYRFLAIDGVGHVGPASVPTTITTNKVTVSKPSAPSKAKKNKAFTVYTVVLRNAPYGSSPVRIDCYKQVKGRWKRLKIFSAKAQFPDTEGTFCTAKVKLPAGKWRLRARDVASGVVSGWRSVTVR